LAGARPGRFVHPGELRQAGLEGVLDVLDHLDSDLLAVAREFLLDERPAEREAERAVGRPHAALPARLELLLPLEAPAEEGEVLVDEGLAQALGLGREGER